MLRLCNKVGTTLDHHVDFGEDFGEAAQHPQRNLGGLELFEPLQTNPPKVRAFQASFKTRPVDDFFAFQASLTTPSKGFQP